MTSKTILKKDIEGYPNYVATSDGKIVNKKTNHPLKPEINHSGYETVKLYKNNHPTVKTVHKLIAQALIPNIYNKPTVNHIDGNKRNNNIDNLEWNTYSENLKHAYKHNLHKNNLTTEIHRKGGEAATINKRKKVYVKDIFEVYDSLNECSRKLNLNRSSLSRACNKQAKDVNGYHVCFLEDYML